MHPIEWTPNRAARAIVGDCARSIGKSGGLSEAGCPINKHVHEQVLVWTLINKQTGDLKTLNCSKQTR
jgi:hypothetical protein